MRNKEAKTRVAETADRFKVSNEAVSHLSNELRAQDGIITKEDKTMVTNSKNVERMRKKACVEKKESFKGFKAQGLMVDERINSNKIEVGVGDKGHKRFAKERQEDCAVIGYPGEVFLGHRAPEGGKAVELARSLFKFIQEREVNIDDLQVLLADGCNKMSGHKHGFITEFERLLGRPLLHMHCICHGLEKVFSHVFVFYAGPTTGPESWSGEEAKRLTGSVWELPVVAFEAVPSSFLRALLTTIPEAILIHFNSDTRYLLEMARAVESGELEPRWARHKAGLMTNIRWMNTESQELRVYMSTLEPTMAQRRMTSFIINVFVPSFLEIQQKNLLVEGPRHLLAIVQRTLQFCTLEEVELLTPVIQFNGYFAQTEVVVTSMLASSSKEERQHGLEIISQLRKKEKRSKRKTVRKVKTPTINMEATRLCELVDLDQAASSPPILSQYTDTELQEFLEVPYSVELPCTTIAVERGVKVT